MIPGLGFLLGGPARLYGLAIGALALALTLAGLAAWGLYWRGEAREARAAISVYQAQLAVSADALERCSSSVEEARRVGDAAIAASHKLLAEARRLSAGSRAQAERIEALLRQPVPAKSDGTPAGCEEAWAEIQRLRGAR